MNDVLKQMLNDIDVGLKNALIRVNELVAENKALKEALAQDDLCSSQEPWMYRIWNDKDAQWRLTDDCSWPAEPIYTTPPNPKSQPEQKPVAWKYKTNFYMSDKDDGMRLTYSLGVAEVNAQSGSIKPLYTAPPQRKPLTSQERDAQRWRFLMENSYDSESVTQFHVWEHSWEPHSQTGEPTEWKQRVRGIALIDFIDRAIEAAHGIKE